MTKRLRPQLSPEAEAVIRMQRGLSRRSLMSGAGLVGLGSVLAACGTWVRQRWSSRGGKPSPAVDKSDKVVNWASCTSTT
jgi:hypothetical protein